MKKIIDKLNFNIDEFKNNYWYSKTIEIPQFIKNIEPNISEIYLFNKLLFNVFKTCDLFINQKMSQFLALDLTLEQIIEILGKQRVSNFISSVYTEIKYRLATEKFPEFSQKDKLITSNFSLATTGREFNNFQSLLCSESIAYLTYPSWNDLKINKDDYVNILEYLKTNNDKTNNILDKFNEKIKKIDEFKNKLNSVDETFNKLNEFDSKIEKLLLDNSQSDENLKLSFSTFKTAQEIVNKQSTEKINSLVNDKENKLSDNVRNFLNNNIKSSDYLGPKDGDDYLKITFDNDELGMDVCGEQYQTFVRPEGVRIASAGTGIDLSYDEISFPHPDDESKPKQTIKYEAIEKWNASSGKVNSFNKDIEDIKKQIKNLPQGNNASLYDNLKTLFQCEEWDIEDKQNKTIEDFYEYYNDGDWEKTLIFKDKDGKIALFTKSENDEYMFLDFSNKSKFWIREYPFLDSEKLDRELTKSYLIEHYFFDSYTPKSTFTFRNKEEIKQTLRGLTFEENRTYVFYKQNNDHSQNLYFIGKYVLMDKSPALQMFNVANNKEYPFIFYIRESDKEIWDPYHFLKSRVDENTQEIREKQDNISGLKFVNDSNYTLIDYKVDQAKIRIGANTDKGYTSNFFFDRERDGKNIVRYIEKDNETFLNLTPALQSDTHIEIGIKNSDKYISLKIDNEELLLDKTKLLKLKSLLS